MTSKYNLLIFSIILLFIFTPYAHSELKELSKLDNPPLTQMPKVHSVGDSLKWLRKGKPEEWKVTQANSKTVVYLGGSGCKEKFLTHGFALPIEWSNCKPFGTGTAIVTLKGEIWPLKINKIWKFQIKGDNWQTVRKCKVKKAVKVAINLGEFDAYKVECSDSWNKLAWYIDTSTGQELYFTHSNSHFKFNNTLEAAELIK